VTGPADCARSPNRALERDADRGRFDRDDGDAIVRKRIERTEFTADGRIRNSSPAALRTRSYQRSEVALVPPCDGATLGDCAAHLAEVGRRRRIAGHEDERGLAATAGARHRVGAPRDLS
jgi:hypothetical protein